MRLVNLTSRLNSQEGFLDAAALIDVLLIALMFTLIGSRFILAPGVGIDLAQMEAKASQNDMSVIDSDLTVLNAKSNTMLIFNGAIYTADSFKKQMQKNAREKASVGKTLLVKADKSVSAQMLMEICRSAKIGGFEKIRLAAKEAKGDEKNN